MKVVSAEVYYDTLGSSYSWAIPAMCAIACCHYNATSVPAIWSDDNHDMQVHSADTMLVIVAVYQDNSDFQIAVI